MKTAHGDQAGVMQSITVGITSLFIVLRNQSKTGNVIPVQFSLAVHWKVCNKYSVFDLLINPNVFLASNIQSSFEFTNT